eukprot:scaffold447221_cov17-Prasinocladus_malaysianus.AAC.1
MQDDDFLMMIHTPATETRPCLVMARAVNTEGNSKGCSNPEMRNIADQQCKSGVIILDALAAPVRETHPTINTGKGATPDLIYARSA